MTPLLQPTRLLSPQNSSSIHGILQARILEWVAIAFSGDPGNDQFFAHRRRGNQSDCIRLREDGAYVGFFWEKRFFGEKEAEEFMFLKCGVGKDS